MSGDRHPPSFVDTNIFVYAVAEDEPERRRVAQNLLESLAEDDALLGSTQVLQELYSVLTAKIKRRFTPAQALDYLDRIAKAPMISIDYSMIRDAARLSARDQLSFWDALIVAAAERSGAKRLYSEDLQHGRKIHGIEVLNPFRLG